MYGMTNHHTFSGTWQIKKLLNKTRFLFINLLNKIKSVPILIMIDDDVESKAFS